VSVRLACVLPMFALLAAIATGCTREPVPTVTNGKVLYAENGCASCHGAAGRGDGLIAATLAPRPTDFHDESAFITGFEVAPIAATIANGLSFDAPLPPNAAEARPRHGQGMPPFGHLSEMERRSLALYVMSFRNESR